MRVRANIPPLYYRQPGSPLLVHMCGDSPGYICMSVQHVGCGASRAFILSLLVLRTSYSCPRGMAEGSGVCDELAVLMGLFINRCIVYLSLLCTPGGIMAIMGLFDVTTAKIQQHHLPRKADPTGRTVQ